MCVEFSRACALVRFKHKKHLGLEKNIMVWIKISVLFTAIMDGGGLTSCEKYPQVSEKHLVLSPQKQLKIPAGVFKKHSFVSTKTAEKVCRCL